MPLPIHEPVEPIGDDPQNTPDYEGQEGAECQEGRQEVTGNGTRWDVAQCSLLGEPRGEGRRVVFM